MSDKRSVQKTLNTKTAIVLFCAIAVVWLLLDRISKIACDSYGVGQVIYPNVIGLFEFRLAHNTGAAWSIFSDSTFILGVFSILVCIALAVYLFAVRKCKAHLLEIIGLALVFAGGLGNAFDRFAYGYVVDFIHTTFMNFPIFNVADIGVTCGIALFFIGSLLYLPNIDEKDDESGEQLA